MAGSLLLPLVSKVAGMAGDELVQRVTRMWGVDDDRDKLERRLLAVQSLLADAEVKSETNPAVKRWMKDLQAVAYQADDVIDDFQYEALRREAQRRWSKTSKILSYFTSQNRLVFRYKTSRELKNVLAKIDELMSEMNTFGLVEREVPQVLYRQTHSALDESAEIFGRDDDKEMVVKLLLNQQDQQNVQVFPIIGMGGLGKTTLTKMVYNDLRVQNHFELKMWYCVSENFEPTAIVRSVIELATNERCDLPNNIELLRRKLQEAIGRKRFLLILDDVWNEDQHKWQDDLKPLLCSSIGGSGSMIIVTSRSPRVASIMGTLPPHELACLNEDDSWELFSRKAFIQGLQEQSDLVTIGRRIVNSCKGLPLALKTMGGLMSSKQQVQEWEAISESNIGDTSRGQAEVLSILKLSYRHLSSEMKQCFAFCAVFPKDYEMEKDMLIRLWIANGYIHEDVTMDLVQKGELIFNELAWRSFLQDVKVRKYFGITSYKNEIGCKMHDLMHDLAKHVTDECAFAEELIQGKASVKYMRHMKMSPYEFRKFSGLLKGTSSLRTLLIGSADSVHMDLKELKLTSLRAVCGRVLSITHSHTSHLRYLDLSGSQSIVRLPNSVCLLYNLQILRLINCSSLQYLPEGMATMKKLIHLYLYGCESLKRMPPNLGLLHNLRTLTTFVVHTRDGCGIEELKDLRHLSNERLELFNLREVKSGSKVNLHEKQNLRELVLYWGRNFHDHTIDDDANKAEEVLESLKPHGELKTLAMTGYGGLAISQWMGNPQMLQHIKNLSISSCPRCNDLPIVWLSPTLEYLSLCELDSLTTLCKNIDVEGDVYNTSLQILPKLKEMKLSNLPKLEKWAETCAEEPISKVMIPLLEELNIYGCCKLGTLPESPVLKSLSVLHGHADVVSMRMPLGIWPSLLYLKIELPAGVVMPIECQQRQRQRPLNTTGRLDVERDGAFVSIFNMSTLQLGLWDCLAFVEELVIRFCHDITRFPVVKLDGNGSSSEEILRLPQLKRLRIVECKRLQEIFELPTSLEELEIRICQNLVVLPSNLGNLSKLRKLCLDNCEGLNALPERMDDLTSLEELTIRLCPGIEKFPQGLLQRLPSLKYLNIWAHPNLERACREGGEYFDLVSSIPQKFIDSYIQPGPSRETDLDLHETEDWEEFMAMWEAASSRDPSLRHSRERRRGGGFGFSCSNWCQRRRRSS
ncbi:hypothetical protein ACP70R_047117 [Stipagrostis hirtigluma subsp. patula]